MKRPVLVSATLAVLAITGLPAVESPLVLPGQLAVIDTLHLHALVPAAQASILRPQIERADAIYVHLAQDAGYVIRERLNLLVSDDAEDHNGYSTVVPRPIIQIELAPALPRSGIFDGDDIFLRTFIHEATHHLCNDRPHGISSITERFMGRVLPEEPLSLVTAIFTIPPHAFSPFFWHEGMAQWAETEYADPTSPWGGRGRDSLTHLVWRLDAAAGEIPPVNSWRRSYQNWPYGNRVYLYGLAYTRWLQGAYGAQVPLWKAVTSQGHRFPFVFDSGAQEAYGRTHGDMIAEARRDLLAEQQAQLAVLRQAPVTELVRQTPSEVAIGAPAWMADGGLFAAFVDSYDLPVFAKFSPGLTKGEILTRDRGIKRTRRSAYARGEVRGGDDGSLIWSEPVRDAGTSEQPSRLHLRTPNGFVNLVPGDRLLQPTLRTQPTTDSSPDHRRYQVAALHLIGGGRQELVIADVTVGDGFLSRLTTPNSVAWATLPTQDHPWSPVFQPHHDSVAWVETDHAGARLILAPVPVAGQPAGPRTILASIPGRIIHPTFSADGEYLYFCADHTGVANAYRVAVARPGTLEPITNVLGGVIACVPSPDGKDLALVAFDRQGSFLTRIANDPAGWAKQVPAITLQWPAPVTVTPPPAKPTNLALEGQTPRSIPPEQTGPAATISPYQGFQEIRPLFWTPTTLVTPDGGLGVVARAADPVNTHQVLASVGVGDVQGSPVGFAGYVFAPYQIQAAAAVWRNERTWYDSIVDSGGKLQDYTENIETAEGRVGYGLAGNAWRLQSYLAVGVSHWQENQESINERNGQSIISQTPFSGSERYVEVAIARSSSTYFPTSYANEAGSEFALVYRHSGLGGDLGRRRLIASVARIWSIWPEAGHQIVTAGSLGWSDQDGDQSVQSQFTVGGRQGFNLVRGYPVVAQGPYLATYSLGYRLPIWRPFQGFGTSPWSLRQVVVETFLDAGKISPDRILGEGNWIHSAGAEAHVNLEAWALDLNPGLGIAKQLDAAKDTTVYLTLGYRW